MDLEPPGSFEPDPPSRWAVTLSLEVLLSFDVLWVPKFDLVTLAGGTSRLPDIWTLLEGNKEISTFYITTARYCILCYWNGNFLCGILFRKIFIEEFKCIDVMKSLINN